MFLYLRFFYTIVAASSGNIVVSNLYHLLLWFLSLVECTPCTLSTGNKIPWNPREKNSTQFSPRIVSLFLRVSFCFLLFLVRVCSNCNCSCLRYRSRLIAVSLTTLLRLKCACSLVHDTVAVREFCVLINLLYRSFDELCYRDDDRYSFMEYFVRITLTILFE